MRVAFYSILAGIFLGCAMISLADDNFGLAAVQFAIVAMYTEKAG